MPHALTAMTACLATGVGGGTSVRTSVSGGPNSWQCMALMASDLFHGRAMTLGQWLERLWEVNLTKSLYRASCKIGIISPTTQHIRTLTSRIATICCGDKDAVPILQEALPATFFRYAGAACYEHRDADDRRRRSARRVTHGGGRARPAGLRCGRWRHSMALRLRA